MRGIKANALKPVFAKHFARIEKYIMLVYLIDARSGGNVLS